MGPGARVAAALLLPLILPACQAVQAVDDRLRRIDVLDRAFARPTPSRSLPAPAPPRPAPLLPPPVAAPPAGASQGPAAAPIIDPAPAIPRDVPPGPPAARPPAATPPDQVLRIRSLVQGNPWLARFWAELTPGQRLLVTQRLAAGAAARGAGPAEAWDGMGLGDRALLVFGTGAG